MGVHRKKQGGGSGKEANNPGKRLVSMVQKRRVLGPGVDGNETVLKTKHTTEAGDTGPSMLSVLDNNDLTEFLDIADLAEHSFAAERRNATIIVESLHEKLPDSIVAAKEAVEAMIAHKEAMRCPRRPAWNSNMEPEELSHNERETFLVWRRALATVEEQGHQVTPFEKNLEVWRQLWRVLERSHLVVQVVDARDPLMYRCEDVEQYCRELCPNKEPVLLLNKADLLSDELRQHWAKYFTERGIRYFFFSATEATKLLELQQAGKELPEPAHPSAPLTPEEEKYPCRVLAREELMQRLEEVTIAAATANGTLPHPREGEPPRPVVAGFIGYPNVGKSSTLNALIGVKKASVAATPGKTKHFQTISISPEFMLCDCPGLVFPSFTTSRAEMAISGLVPIDRLTDIRAPIELIGQRAPRQYLEALYGLRLPRPEEHEDQNRCPNGPELLRAFALSRHYVAGSGLPDETKAGRIMLKDYRDGKIRVCRFPPTEKQSQYDAPFWSPFLAPKRPPKPRAPLLDEAELDEGMLRDDLKGLSIGGRKSGHSGHLKAPERLGGQELSGMLGGLAAKQHLEQQDYILKQAAKGKQTRAAHKFNKKAIRTKGNRGVDNDFSGDGRGFAYGKKGGMKPAENQY